MNIHTASPTITGYTIKISAKQTLSVVVKSGPNAYCSVSTKTEGGRNLPFGKVFHGEDCLIQALNSYKRATVKKAIRQAISEQV